MDFLDWLQYLSKDVNAAAAGFQARPMYIFVCVMFPVLFGLVVGFGMRLLERVFGIELGKGGGH